jgi:lactate dehydrogenase-like 2-hydroxyacid dehydrogenase
MVKKNKIFLTVAGKNFKSIVNYLSEYENIHVSLIDITKNFKKIKNCDVLIPTMTTIDSSIMQNAANLKLIQQWGSGLEGVDIDEATKRGIAVANVPTAGTYNAESVAEWCVMAAIAISRSYPLIHKNVLKGGPWGYPIGESLIGKRVGIIGFGGIGKALALRLKAFGCEIVAVKRNSDETLAKEYGLKWVKSLKDLDELLYTSKYIFLCLPLNNESENLIGERELSIIKSGSYIINPSRGKIINKEALLKALRNFHIKAAALDVFWEEPTSKGDKDLRLKNLLLTPHIAGVTDISYEHIAKAVVRNIYLIINNKTPINCVNMDYINFKK